MNGSELALAPKDLGEAKTLATTLSKASLLTEALRGKEADVLLIIMSGHEMGIAPMQALRMFDVIKGRLAMRPEGMVATVRSNANVEFIRCTESTPTKATWQSKLKGQDFVASSTFTMEDAKTAGLAGQDNYRKWPANMLQWRAASMHCKRHHSDIIMGFYSTEEVESFERDATPVVAAKAEAIDTTATVAAVKAAVKAKRTLNVVDEPKADALPPPPPTPEPPPLTDADFVPTAVRP